MPDKRDDSVPLESLLEEAWNAMSVDLDYGVREARRIQRLARASNHTAAMAEALVIEGHCLTLQGAWTEGENCLVQGTVLAASLPSTLPLVIGSARLAAAWSRRGLVNEALRHLEAITSFMSECPDRRELEELSGVMGLLFLRSGRGREAVRPLIAQLRSWLTVRKRPRSAQAFVASTVSTALIHAGRPRAAVRILETMLRDPAIEPDCVGHFNLTTTLALAHVVLGDARQTRVWRNRASEMPQSASNSVWGAYLLEIEKALQQHVLHPLTRVQAAELVNRFFSGHGRVSDQPNAVPGHDLAALRESAARSSLQILQSCTTVHLSTHQRTRLEDATRRAQALVQDQASPRDLHEPVCGTNLPSLQLRLANGFDTTWLLQDAVLGDAQGTLVGQRFMLRRDPGQSGAPDASSPGPPVINQWLVDRVCRLVAMHERPEGVWAGLCLGRTPWTTPGLLDGLVRAARLHRLDLARVRVEFPFRANRPMREGSAALASIASLGCSLGLSDWRTLARLPDALESHQFQIITLDAVAFESDDPDAPIADRALLSAWLDMVRACGLKVAVSGLRHRSSMADLQALGVTEFHAMR